MFDLLIFADGIVMLLIGGRTVVAGVIDIAQRLGLPTLLIGLTLVAWGTSAPEPADDPIGPPTWSCSSSTHLHSISTLGQCFSLVSRASSSQYAG
ncbi:hypothetical protein [Nodularia spumigena]|uniref:hypothetical protein n=1 Tax=Nodularia spumigena TaxID=70799 RepID=UPI00396A377C